jgi:hypothetical protein
LPEYQRPVCLPFLLMVFLSGFFCTDRGLHRSQFPAVPNPLSVPSLVAAAYFPFHRVARINKSGASFLV